MMTIKELRACSLAQLQEALLKLLKQHADLRLSYSESTKKHELMLLRRGIARIKTLITEKTKEQHSE